MSFPPGVGKQHPSAATAVALIETPTAARQSSIFRRGQYGHARGQRQRTPGCPGFVTALSIEFEDGDARCVQFVVASQMAELARRRRDQLKAVGPLPVRSERQRKQIGQAADPRPNSAFWKFHTAIVSPLAGVVKAAYSAKISMR